MSFATSLLGTHVSRRSRILRPFTDVFFSQCQPEIDDVRLAVFANQDVARLHVPMHESLFVSVMQRLGHGCHQLGGVSVLEPLLLELR